MKLEIIGARLARGSFENEQKRQIDYDKVKFYSLTQTQHPSHKGMEVGIFEGPGWLWEKEVQAMTFPGTFELNLGQTLRGGKFVQVVEGIKQVAKGQ